MDGAVQSGDRAARETLAALTGAELLPEAQRSRCPALRRLPLLDPVGGNRKHCAQHWPRYGAVTGITLTTTRCGVKERWQPLVQSWTESELCLAPQTSKVVAVRNFHEFFGESKLVRYSCVGGSALSFPLDFVTVSIYGS